MMVSSIESSIPNRLAIWMLIILSILCCSDVLPRIPLRHRLWNDSSFLVMLRVVVQVSDPYSNAPRTTALYVNRLVVRDRFLSLNTGSFSIPKAREALAILSQTSFSTSTNDPGTENQSHTPHSLQPAAGVVDPRCGECQRPEAWSLICCVTVPKLRSTPPVQWQQPPYSSCWCQLQLHHQQRGARRSSICLASVFSPQSASHHTCTGCLLQNLHTSATV